ncbi:MAG: hypothetical protein ACI4EK_07240 [Wujia sp.]
MISPIIAAQTATPIASVQQHNDAQGVLQSQNASKEMQKEEQEVRETVVHKDEAAYYEHNPDAKEEGRNKYQNLYSNKKKKPNSGTKEKDEGVQRINIDIKL